MRKILSSLIVIGLLTLSTAPLVLAQDSLGNEPDLTHKSYLPLVNSAADPSADQQADDVDTPDEDEPAVTELQVAASDTEVSAASARSALRSSAVPANLANLKLAAPANMKNALSTLKLDHSLLGAQGARQVVVRLKEAPLGALGVSASAVEARQAQLARVQSQQATVVQTASSLDSKAKVLGRVYKALNAVMLEVDATALTGLAANPDVLSIHQIKNYELTLTDTVPYIGGTAVQALGFNGSGVRVAVLDSGIDYTHAEFGGAGTVAAYEAAYGTSITDTLNTTYTVGSFPTAKVIGGYDFVGELWPTFGALAPDPDPIDFEGHGTHVGDIIGGVRGVAPGASLYAVKVCSAVATSCSGLALLQAMDFALDPNGDNDVSDHVDIIHMSLGSDYSTAFDDDLSAAVELASGLGVLTVASAGNGSDKPYIAGTPASAPSALSVAQTTVPSDKLFALVVSAPASIAGQYGALLQPWSAPLTGVVEAPVQYGDGAGGNLNGCAAFAANSLAGKIVLVDRGTCNVSLKILNIELGGGLIGVMGLIAPGAPASFSLGSEPPHIPGFVITQAAATKIKSGLASGVTAKFDPAVFEPLVGQMIASSSRGPSMGTNLVKPEIGAPGASVSAEVGTGTGATAFGGTSGAAPMVSGAAALLKQAFPNRSAAEFKALLMNTAETQILNTPVFFGGALAPIARIGGGEVRVDRAVASPAAAWDVDSQSGALSFSFQDITKSSNSLKRLVNVRNYSDHAITYQIKSQFRFADDAQNGAVKIDTPSKIFVPAHRDAQFEVKLSIRGKKLRDWSLNSGALGNNPAPITSLEYDGYLWLTDGKTNDKIHLAWHVLPRKAGDVTLKPKSKYVEVRNRGVATTPVESYSLIAVSPNLPQGGPGDNNPTPDFKYIGYTTIPVPAGICSDGPNPSFILGFAVNTWERQTHAVAPATFEFDLDTNQDGDADYAIFNFDVSLNPNSLDGRNAVWVQDLATGDATSFFYTDHDTNSANTVLYFCGEQIGMDANNFFQPFDLVAGAQDWYFSGNYTDVIGGITISPLGEQYLGVFDKGGVGSTLLKRNASDKLRLKNFGPGTNNTESGLLLLYRGGAPIDREAGTIVVVK